MGCAVESLEKLKQVLVESQKDWCLVVLLDRENPSPAGRQMNRLVDEWDEDSGCAYDFYLPGYNDGEKRETEPWRSEEAGRIRQWAFDHRAFRRIYRDISREAADAWQYLGDCEILLFPTRRRWNGHAENEIAPFSRYNLDDIVKNGNTVKQFLLRMDQCLQGAGKKNWEEVKWGLDEIYSELIMPPQDAAGEQAMRLSQGISELSKTHPKDGYVFISYSTKDWTTAHWIRGRIEKNGVPCWMAPRDIPAGTNYAYIIEQAIARCGIFLVLLSESSAQSVWVHKEILFAQGRLQQQNRFHAAWLSKTFDLEKTGTGMGFAMVDVQIDDGLADGDLTGLLDRFLRYARVPAPMDIPRPAWAAVFRNHPELAADEHFGERCALESLGAKELTHFLKWAALEGMAGSSWEKHIAFARWKGREWSHLLAACPHFAGRCDQWDAFTPEDWVLLLQARPELSGHCGEWGEFSPRDWVRLLRARPEFAKHCKTWREFAPGDWLGLLRERPEFAERCETWEKFGASDWKSLIKARPKLSVWKNGIDGKAENQNKIGDVGACGTPGKGDEEC